MELQGKWALVTGAARRVGREIALELARAGADIVVHYHNSADDAISAKAEIEASGRECRLVRANLAEPQEIEKMAEELRSAGIGCDVLVNSASVFPRTLLTEITAADFDSIIAANLRAPFLLALTLGLEMKARKRGKIINIADAAIRRPARNYAPYLVSKYGLAGLTEVLALELAPEVQVNTVAPGTVLMPEDAPDTMREAIVRRTPLKRVGDPHDVARMVRHLVEHGDFATGGFYPVDGGASI